MIDISCRAPRMRRLRSFSRLPTHFDDQRVRMPFFSPSATVRSRDTVETDGTCPRGRARPHPRRPPPCRPTGRPHRPGVAAAHPQRSSGAGAGTVTICLRSPCTSARDSRPVRASSISCWNVPIYVPAVWYGRDVPNRPGSASDRKQRINQAAPPFDRHAVRRPLRPHPIWPADAVAFLDRRCWLV